MATYAKLPSGSWRAQVRRKGFIRSNTFKLKRDAVEWATNIESQVNSVSSRGLITPTQSFKALVDAFLETSKAKSKTTKYNYELIKTELGHHSLKNLSQLNIQAFADKRLKINQSQTVAGYISNIARVLRWGRKRKRLDIDEAIAMNVRTNLKEDGLRTRAVERDRTPTKEELDVLYNWWAKHPALTMPMPVIVRFALASCMRLGEITRITNSDVDRKKKTVIIRERKDPKDKENNDQVVPLLGEAWEIVESRLDDFEERLFPYVTGSISHNFTRTCKQLDIVDLHFHDLRHAGITELFRRGLTIQLVAIVSGHKSWENLKRYTELNAEDVHNAFR